MMKPSRAWRAWYGSSEWRDIRNARLDGEPLCRMCRRKGKIMAAAVVDHVTPHRGDAALFFCYGNTQSLCKMHHDSTKQQIERIGYSKEVGTDGWPVDPNHPRNKQEPGRVES
jgi:5-methylcytosine-specific restriction protein A